MQCIPALIMMNEEVSPCGSAGNCWGTGWKESSTQGLLLDLSFPLLGISAASGNFHSQKCSLPSSSITPALGPGLM